MGKNIEIKARCEDCKKIRKLLKQLPARLEGVDEQVDTFFHVAEGRLKMRESSLYGALLIPYLRTDAKGPKASEYTLIQTPEAQKTKNLLSRILGVRGVIEKRREIYIYKNVRIHLDQVKNIGGFIEFEAVVSPHDNETASHSNIDYLMTYLHIREKDLISGAYIDILEKMEQEH
ncbi:MAG TPA: CYTH domain-containing protein [Caldithrix abyssi]|uniref:CYTH domain-containing protein n=1 Tax=Caldithrix abyssi TaxID=187145 RepID=A0A7V4U1E6_CALAY|nr:CYTH domain-containing protein [Caldithrix abyssi]